MTKSRLQIRQKISHEKNRREWQACHVATMEPVKNTRLRNFRNSAFIANERIRSHRVKNH